LSSFYSEKKLQDHETCCGANKSVKIGMPKPCDNILQFKNYSHFLKVPFSAYSDLGCMLQKFHTCQPSDEKIYINAYQKYTPANFAYYMK
jgi:hypothetical protein